ERVRAREELAEFAQEEAWRARPRRQPANRRAQQLLSGCQGRPLEDHAAVAQQDRLQVERQATVDVAREQLGGDRGAHVVRNENGRSRAIARQRLLDEIGLIEQAVADLPRLLRKSEAEEVKRHGGARRQRMQRLAPVKGARGKATEEEKQLPFR